MEEDPDEEKEPGRKSTSSNQELQRWAQKLGGKTRKGNVHKNTGEGEKIEEFL